jgi:hypothetical protein
LALNSIFKRDVQASKYILEIQKSHPTSPATSTYYPRLKNMPGSNRGWGSNHARKRGWGLGKVGPYLEGSFEIEKYEKMLYTMSWRVTPGTYNVAAILFL